MTVAPTPDRDLITLVGALSESADSVTTWRRHLDRGLWERFEELGLTSLLSDQDAAWVDVVPVLEECASRGVALPIVEHDVLAGWLLSDGDAKRRPDGLVVPATVDSCGRAPAVPWAADADHVVVLTPGEQARIFVLPATDVTTPAGHDLAGRPCGDVTIKSMSTLPSDGRGVEVAAPADVHAGMLWRHRLARCVEIAGAMAGAIDLAVAYARERTQFGRSLNRFQAVQHLLADAAAEQAVACAATRLAIARADDPGGVDARSLERCVTIAGSVTARSLGVVARNTHQVLGALGTTLEHPLQAVLRLALAWRNELGSVVELERAIGEDALTYEGSAWEWLTN